MTPSALTAILRRHVRTQLYDESGVLPEGTAVYSLSDPRELRELCYIGQTGHPRRRFLQHLNSARLWQPHEIPWWVKSPKLRPLYQWMRALYQDQQRLPVMVVQQWNSTVVDARDAERRLIFDCLSKDLSLLNVEQEILGRQRPLI